MSDQYEGVGGSYRIDVESGKILVARTDVIQEEAPPESEAAIQDQPADAGFFTPVTPAAPADATTTAATE